MYVPQYVTAVKKKKDSNFTILKRSKKHYEMQVTNILYHKTQVLDQIPLSTKNAVHYGVLAIHESIAPYPDTRHYS
jgi:hypothetical protein